MVQTPQVPALPGMYPLGFKPKLTPREIYSRTYTQAFKDTYKDIIPTDKQETLIAKALAVALDNIDNVIIDAPAFKLTAKRLKIKNTKKAIKEFLGQ